MDSTTVVTIAAALLTITAGAFGWLIGWLISHGARLSGVEERVKALGENLADDRQRNDRFIAEVRGLLIRIEDKLDRKADRREP